MEIILEKHVEKLNNLQKESPELLDFLKDVMSFLEKLNGRVNELDSSNYLVKSSLPWPWNVNIPPFPEAWKRTENRANPDAFLLPELQPTNQNDGWREARNYSRPARRDNITEMISTSNRFSPLSSMDKSAGKSKAKINFKRGNVLECYGQSSIVHCIGQDATMGKGFAMQITHKFNCREQIRAQQKKVGDVSVINIGQDQYLFNLVTKPKSGEPPADTKGLYDSLINLRDFCDTFYVKHLSMPKIASGLDQIPWRSVQAIIEKVFENSDIQLDIYSLSPANNFISTTVNEKERRMRVADSQATNGDINARNSDNPRRGSCIAEVELHDEENYCDVVTVVQSGECRSNQGHKNAPQVSCTSLSVSASRDEGGKVDQHQRGRRGNHPRGTSGAEMQRPYRDINADSSDNPGVSSINLDVPSRNKELYCNAVTVVQSGECRSNPGHKNTPQVSCTSLSVNESRDGGRREREDQRQHRRLNTISRDVNAEKQAPRLDNNASSGDNTDNPGCSATDAAVPVRDQEKYCNSSTEAGDINGRISDKINADRLVSDMISVTSNDNKESQTDNMQVSNTQLETEKVLLSEEIPLEQCYTEQSESQIMERVDNFLKKQTPRLWEEIHLAATEVPFPSADDSFASCYSSNDNNEELDLDDFVNF